MSTALPQRLAVIVSGVVLLLQGCSAPERLTNEDTFFEPVARRVQPDRPKPGTSVAAQADVALLEDALARSRREALELRLAMMNLQDSLSLMRAAKSKDEARTKSLVDQISALEQRLLIAQDTTSAAPLWSPTDPKGLPLSTSPSVSRATGSGLVALYNRALGLFRQRKYSEAHVMFDQLLEKGIQENLADNCEYWLGECEFAVGHWSSAIESFEKVMVLRSSDKRADAILMVGRSYEQIRQISRAKTYYQMLIQEYPNSVPARTAAKHLKALSVDDKTEKTPEI